jgi:hypothetical protein
MAVPIFSMVYLLFKLYGFINSDFYVRMVQDCYVGAKEDLNDLISQRLVIEVKNTETGFFSILPFIDCTVVAEDGPELPDEIRTCSAVFLFLFLISWLSHLTASRLSEAFEAAIQYV